MQEMKLYKVSKLYSKPDRLYLPYHKSFIKIKSTMKHNFLLGLQDAVNLPRF